MKKFFLYALLLFTYIVANADNWVRDTEPSILEVHYTRTEVTDTTKRETNFFHEETMLRIGKNMSRYCSVPHYYRDSLMYCAPDLYWQMEAASFNKDPKEHDRTSLERSGRYWSVIYKNFPTEKVTETSYFEMDNWQYEEDWQKPDWEITEETKEIIGYQCFKATANFKGRQWTAWFTPEIPVQDGPWKLCGLPGLILEAEDGNGEYRFVANGLKQNGIPDVGFLCYREKRGVKRVTRDKFFNSWWKFINSNFASKLSQMYGGKAAQFKNEKSIYHHDREETDYSHDL